MEFAELLCLNLSLSYTFEEWIFKRSVICRKASGSWFRALWKHRQIVDGCVFVVLRLENAEREKSADHRYERIVLPSFNSFTLTTDEFQ